MPVSTPDYLKKLADLAGALGSKAVNSDFTFEIEGHEETYLLVKQAPWIELSPQDAIEIPTVLGDVHGQPQQLKSYNQGPITLMETAAGTISNLMLQLILGNAGVFNAKIYEGTPLHFLRYKQYRNCFISLEAPSRDFENRSQILTFEGTLHFHYFGEQIAGNSPSSGPGAYR